MFLICSNSRDLLNNEINYDDFICMVDQGIAIQNGWGMTVQLKEHSKKLIFYTWEFK